MTIRIDEKWRQESGRYRCPHCSKDYSKNGIATHIWRMHDGGVNHKPTLGKESWNKGLTKDVNEKVKQSGETFSNKIKNGELVHNWVGKKHKEESKKLISQKQIIAHREGRAWNIGMSRWNNEPSYPEKFFMQVIENEFNDKNYVREFPIGRYSIDFAWVEKKLAIEIDGAQHEKETYKERDNRKDIYLNNNGWKVLRIKWINMFHNTKEYIEIAKQFISQSQ